MNKKDCAHFDYCDAPICPLDESSMKNATWFPDEEICRLQTYGQVPWIRQQKKIARVIGTYEAGCFTVAMLSHRCAIAKGTKGLDPDIPITDDRIARWIASRKKTKPLSAERKAKAVEALHSARKKNAENEGLKEK